VHAIARGEHFTLTGCAFEIGNTRLLFGIEHHVRGIFTDRDDARREGAVHAANDVRIVEWARTLRIDAPPAGVVDRVAALQRDGVRVRFSDAGVSAPTYVLVEGPDGVDPLELQRYVSGARWYDAEIIALAIEPLPADALPVLAEALGGRGAPAGICECRIDESRLVVEFFPGVTPPALLVRIIDVELRRFGGARRTQLLSPLSIRTAAAIAAQGLQSPEIGTDRILESLLGLEYVE
jgi:hypothetical protein